jgi:ABC-2 type transport system permease protein
VTETLVHTWFMLGRQARNLARQPIWIAIMLVQPMFWLLLYSQLFRRVVELPGFATDSYVQFLTPGIVVMTAFFSATWSGMAMIEDLDRDVVERFLATPVSRVSLVLSQVLRSAITAAIQGLIILLVGLALGARVHGGPLGWIVILLAAALVAAAFAGISHGIALLTRREATMIAVANFFALPLTFVSTTLIAKELMPDWMQVASRFNPVNWAVQAAREPVLTSTDWGASALYLLYLLVFSLATGAFATWAFRSYQRTL